MLLFVIIVLAIVVAHALISELNRPRATVESTPRKRLTLALIVAAGFAMAWALTVMVHPIS